MWKTLDRLLLRYGEGMRCVCTSHHGPYNCSTGYTMLEFAAWFEDGVRPANAAPRLQDKGPIGSDSNLTLE